MLFKCEDCGYTFKSVEEPEKCANCARQNRKKKKGFEQLPESAPQGDAGDAADKPDYHWACDSCGFKFAGAGVPHGCPNCERQGQKSKGFTAKSDEARMNQGRAAEKEVADGDDEPAKTPTMKWTKAEIIAHLEKMGVEVIYVKGEPVAIKDCVNKMPPTKEDLLGLYLKTMEERAEPQ